MNSYTHRTGHRGKAAEADATLPAEGIHEPDGTVLIWFNTDHQHLPAPPGENGEPRRYLPCHECGNVEAVGDQVVTRVCERCWEAYEESGQWEGRQGWPEPTERLNGRMDDGEPGREQLPPGSPLASPNPT